MRLNKGTLFCLFGIILFIRVESVSAQSCTPCEGQYNDCIRYINNSSLAGGDQMVCTQKQGNLVCDINSILACMSSNQYCHIMVDVCWNLCEQENCLPAMDLSCHTYYYPDYTSCDISYTQCYLQMCSNNSTPPGGGSGGGGGGYSNPNLSTPTPNEIQDMGNGCPKDSCDAIVGEPVNLTNGNVFFHHSDYIAGGLSSELTLVRTYNSQSTHSGIFGIGWSTPFDEKLEFTKDNNNTVTKIGLISGDGAAVYYTRVDQTNEFAISYPADEKSSIIANQNGTYTLLLKTGAWHTFNANGNLTEKADRNGNITTFTYSSGLLTKVTAPTDRALNFIYTSGKVSSVSDSITGPASSDPVLGLAANYAYDSTSGLLSQVTYKDGSQYKYFYEYKSVPEKYYLTEVQNALGHILEKHDYDNNTGKAVTSEKADGVEKYNITYLNATQTRVEDALNRTTEIKFKNVSGKNVIESITGPYMPLAQPSPDEKYKKEYSDILNLTSETDLIGNKTLYGYDYDGNVTAVISPIKRLNFTYNEFGQIITATDVLGKLENIYDVNGNLLTSVTNTYDSSGNLPNNTEESTHYLYNGMGLPTEKTDPRGKKTYYYYDAYYNLTSVVDALNNTTSFQYDARGRVRTITNALLEITQMDYDSKDRLTSVTYPDNSEITLEYNLADQLETVMDENGNVTTFIYDAYGRLSEIAYANGKNTIRHYDAMSNLTSEEDELGRVTNYEYTETNQVKKIIYPAATPNIARLEVNFEYDAAGNLIKNTDTAGNETEYFQDAGGRVVKTTDPENNDILMHYDVHDNLTTVIAGGVYEFSYDYNNRLMKIRRDGGWREREYIRDLAGNVEKMKDYDRKSTLYTYDDLNRLTTISYPDNTGASFTYDALSRLKTATNDVGTVTYYYDNRGRVSSVTDVWGKTVNYGYDFVGNKTSVGVFNGPTLLYGMTYVYDTMNRVTSQTDSKGVSATFTYDDMGKLENRTLNGVFKADYGYDDLDRVTGINYKFNNNHVASFGYLYDDAMNISEITDNDGMHTYQYDGKSQLTSAAHSAIGLENETFNYTGTGTNINADLTLPPQGINYQYNAKGDLRLRLDDNKAPTNKSIQYKYDAMGRLVARVDGLQWTRYTYDGEDVIMDVKSDGTQVFYGNGPGIDNKLWYTNGSSAAVYYLTDHLGSTRALISNSGTTLGTISYDSFGTPLGTTGTIGTRFLYAGRDYDADTELYYYRARWYDPQARRFISEDPIGLNGGINLYAYVGNNPINRRDPSGKIMCTYDVRGENMVCYGNDDLSTEVLNINVASGNNNPNFTDSAGNSCKNNPACQHIHDVGPIPGGWWMWTTGFTNMPNGRVLEPLLGTNTVEGRTNIRSHSCLNPFGPALGPEYCSQGCVTGTGNDIQSLNELLDKDNFNLLRVGGPLSLFERMYWQNYIFNVIN